MLYSFKYLKLKQLNVFCMLLVTLLMLILNFNSVIYLNIILPLFAIALILLVNSYKLKEIRNVALTLSLISLINSFILWIKFIQKQTETFILNINWNNLNLNGESTDFLTSYFSVSINHVSILFIILINFLSLICILITWNWVPYFHSIRVFIILIFIIQFCCINFFVSTNLIVFYIFFESVLIPMYFLIGVWGLRDRKIHASYQFFLYTFFGSLFLLVGLVILGYLVDSYDMNYINEYWWYYSDIKLEFQLFIWLCIFLGFAIKVPVVPFHIWLPEAHVEAPTAGSIILAGILLKFGTYGFYRILVQLLPLATIYFTKLVICISLMSIFYASIVTYAQIDLKKIIAYSSVSHMGYVTLGLVLDNVEGIGGAIYMMLTHGVISGGLFYIVGILYERYGTRNVYYYGGLKNIMPKYVFFFFLLTLANMNLPLTGGFVAEFLVLIGTGGLESKIISFLAALGLVTNGVYCIWLFNRLCMGINIGGKDADIKYNDLDKRELLILSMFLVFIIIMGIFPNGILNVIETGIIESIWGRNLLF